MKRLNCENCKKPTEGTNSRRFCSDSCRVAHWQKQQRKKKTRLGLYAGKYKKPVVVSAGHELLKVIAALMNLEDMSNAGDRDAWDALEQIDNRLSVIARNRKDRQ